MIFIHVVRRLIYSNRTITVKCWLVAITLFHFLPTSRFMIIAMCSFATYNYIHSYIATLGMPYRYLYYIYIGDLLHSYHSCDTQYPHTVVHDILLTVNYIWSCVTVSFYWRKLFSCQLSVEYPWCRWYLCIMDTLRPFISPDYLGQFIYIYIYCILRGWIKKL